MYANIICWECLLLLQLKFCHGRNGYYRSHRRKWQTSASEKFWGEANEYHGKECVALYASVDFFCRSRQMLLGNSGSITYHFCEWVNWVNLAAEYNLPFVDGHLIVSRGLLVNTNCALDSEFELKTWGCKFFFHFKEPHVSAIMTRTVKVFQKKKKTFFVAVFKISGWVFTNIRNK